MQIINKKGKLVDLSYEASKSEKKVDFEFQQLGIELEPFYGKVIWRMFYMYPLTKIQDAHKVCVEKGITKIAFLIGVMKRMK